MSFHREPTDSVPDETIVSRTARLCATLFATNGQFMSRHRLSCNLHSERPMRRLCGTKGGGDYGGGDGADDRASGGHLRDG